MFAHVSELEQPFRSPAPSRTHTSGRVSGFSGFAVGDSHPEQDVRYSAATGAVDAATCGLWPRVTDRERKGPAPAAVAPSPATITVNQTIRFMTHTRKVASHVPIRGDSIGRSEVQLQFSGNVGRSGNVGKSIPTRQKPASSQKGQDMAGVRSLVRGLIAPTRGARLSESTHTRGNRMARLVTMTAALAVFLALGVGVYGRFFAAPPAPPADPEFVADAKTPLPAADEFEHLAKTDSVAMYEKCLSRYLRDAKGFTATLVKRERVDGEPKPPKEPQEEVIQLAVRGDTPDPATGTHFIEVAMKWESGAKKAMGSEIRGTLYSEKPGAEGTGGKVVTFRPTALMTTTSVRPADPLAKSQSRYSIRDAGMYRGMLRTYDVWKHRKAAGTLKTEYVGKQAIPQIDGRVCYVIDRICATPEADPFELGGAPITNPAIIARDGHNRVRIMIDAETWLQVGSELYRPDGELLASYYFRNANTNPTFPSDTFTLTGLKAKK
ncbi:MAG: hypothetical protein C0467_31130 [Planctomycetaceae bacterium]|nr:hypothetical protein [Planctomycetaceae bacterium]